MLNRISCCILLLAGLTSCDNTVQYAVIVKNATDSDLIIEYKTLNDVRGEVEEKTTLEKGEMQFTINTTNLAIEGSNGTTADHHPYVAEYVRAIKNGDITSKLKWYDEKIRFEKTDIGQAEFTIEYTEKDF